jgi:hypothetical protein
VCSCRACSYALVGAELLLPSYLFVGETVAGDPFFLAERPGMMSAVKGATTYFSVAMPYLVYYGGSFVGLSPNAPSVGAGGSAFLSAMREAFDAGDQFLLGLRINPDGDFGVLTADFTTSGSMSFTNVYGAVTSTPEPATFGLVGGALAVMAWRARQRRRMTRQPVRYPA